MPGAAREQGDLEGQRAGLQADLERERQRVQGERLQARSRLERSFAVKV